MHASLRFVALTVALTSTTGCGIKMLRPLVAGFEGDRQQECVEAALRGAPDPAAVPAAMARFTAGCESDDPAACSALGVMYELGRGVKKDAARAFALYEGACKAHNDAGCVNLGLAYRGGIGTRVDVEHAAALFTIGCDGGNDYGCVELATLRKLGLGVARSPQIAAGLFQVSCENGHADACYRLAGMFEEGTLGPDPMTTLTLYEKSCAYGKKESCERVDALYAQMRRSRPRHPTERCPAGACSPSRVSASAR